MKKKLITISFSIFTIMLVAVFSMGNNNNVMKQIFNHNVEALSNGDGLESIYLDFATSDKISYVRGSGPYKIDILYGGSTYHYEFDIPWWVVERLNCCITGYHGCRPFAEGMDGVKCAYWNKGYQWWDGVKVYND